MESRPRLAPRWLPNFDRASIWTGALHRRAAEGVIGTASTWVGANMALALDAYAPELDRLAREGVPASEIVERVRVEDVRWALDALTPIGGGPWVVVEPRPSDEDDPASLYRSAVEVAAEVDRAGSVLLLPATAAGFEVGAVLLGDGLGVAFSPVLAPSALRGALEASRVGFETRRRIGADLSPVPAFGWVPVDRLAELAPELTPNTVMSALDELLRAERGKEATDASAHDSRVLLLVPGAIERSGWVGTGQGPELAPSIPRVASERLEALQERARVDQRRRSERARASLLARVEERRARALAALLPRLSIGPGEMVARSRSVAETWGGDEQGVVERIREQLALTDLFEDLAEEVFEADVEEILWISHPDDAAAGQAWVDAYVQLDGHPEIVFAEPGDAAAALAGLGDAAIVVLSGLTDDRAVTAVARTVVDAVGSSASVVVARPGSGLARFAQEHELLEVLLPLGEVRGPPDTFALEAVFPALLLGLDPDELLAGLDAFIGSCQDELPPYSHAGVRLAATLVGFRSEGGEAFRVDASPGLGGFAGWLAGRVELADIGLRVDSGAADARLEITVEGESEYAEDDAGTELRFDVRAHLGDRMQIVQEMLRWTVALELAAHWGFAPPGPAA